MGWGFRSSATLRLMWFLKLRWWLSCAFALFVGGWGANIELKGRAQADAFCEWVRIGGPRTGDHGRRGAARGRAAPHSAPRLDRGRFWRGAAPLLPRVQHHHRPGEGHRQGSTLRQHAVLSASGPRAASPGPGECVIIPAGLAGPLLGRVSGGTTPPHPRGLDGRNAGCGRHEAATVKRNDFETR